ncbi:hypothetical protein V2H77_15255 [Photorhabdus sp. P32]|uniref:hypothetical protein n=1 Tax=Photorhabdus sp. P32 TaxID=3117549 RepID=UPI00311ADFED
MTHSQMSLEEVISRVQQAQTVLSVWMKALTTDDGNVPDMVDSVITILDGLPDAIALQMEEPSMSHETTLPEMAEKACQAEIICRMLESYPHEMTEPELEAIYSLLSKLTGNVAYWLVEELAQKGGR